MIFSVFSPTEPVLFEKIAPLQRWPLRSPSRIYPLLFDLNSDPSETTDLSRTRPERWSGWSLGSGEEPGNHKYIYITANLSHMICLILYIYMYVRCKSMVPHLPGEGLWIIIVKILVVKTLFTKMCCTSLMQNHLILEVSWNPIHF